MINFFGKTYGTIGNHFIEYYWACYNISLTYDPTENKHILNKAV